MPAYSPTTRSASVEARRRRLLGSRTLLTRSSSRMDSSDYRRPSLTCRRSPNRPATRRRLTGGLRCRGVHEAIIRSLRQEPKPAPDGVSVPGEHAGPLAAPLATACPSPGWLGTAPTPPSVRSAVSDPVPPPGRTTLASTIVSVPLGRVGGVVMWTYAVLFRTAEHAWGPPGRYRSRCDHRLTSPVPGAQSSTSAVGPRSPPSPKRTREPGIKRLGVGGKRSPSDAARKQPPDRRLPMHTGPARSSVCRGNGRHTSCTIGWGGCGRIRR